MKKRISVLIRIALLFLCALITAAATAFALSYSYLIETAEQQAGETAEAAASAAMVAIGSKEGLDALYEDEAQRDTVLKEYRFICQRNDIRYLYLYTLDEKEVRHYVLAAGNSDEDNALVQDKLGFGATGSTPLYDAERNVLSGKKDGNYEVINNEFGKVCMYILPLLNRDGRVIALIGADYSMESIRSRVLSDLKLLLFSGILILTIIYVLALLLIERAVIRPVKKLSEQMQSFVSDRKSNAAVQKRETRYEDEITDIENSFDKMRADIGQYIGEIEDLTSEKVYNRTQLDVARKIQNGIVPEELSMSGDHFDVYGCVMPAKEVGGDFYDIFVLDDTHVCVIIGDISGKSISAALFMVMVKTMIRENLKSGLRLAETFNLANRTLYVSNPENMFATVFACILDTETGIVTYANAGHEEPLVLGRKPHYLEMNSGMALGIFADSDIVEEEISLSDGEGLFLYTDGIPEAINSGKKQFGLDRLMAEAVKDYSDDLKMFDARMLAGDVTAAVKRYADGMEQFDDMTCLALLYRGSDSESRAIVPDIRSFATVKKTLISSIGESAHTKQVILACEEMFSNIVNYSGADHVFFGCRRYGNTWYVSFVDNGTEFDPVKTELPERNFEDLEFGGMGIKLARAISKDMIYTRMDGKNFLIMSFETGNVDPAGKEIQ